MPATKNPRGKTPTTQGNDYTGPYDGDQNRWMTRKVTTERANKTYMVPEKSKPTEALPSIKETQGDQAFGSKSHDNLVTPGKWKTGSMKGCK